MKKIMMMLTALLTISLSACIPALCTPTRSLSQSKSSKKATIGAFRAYFQLADGITAVDSDPANTIRAFVLNFGDDSEASGIENVQSSMANGQSASWYDMLGRKLNGKPTATGMYINNGKKVAIK